MRFCVYVFYDGDTPVYVGKGLAGRPWRHMLHGSHNLLLDRFFLQCNLEGTPLKIKIVFRTNDELEAFAHEHALIKYYGRLDKDEGPLFNRCEGQGRRLFIGSGTIAVKLQVRFEQKLASFKRKSLWVVKEQKQLAMQQWLRRRRADLSDLSLSNSIQWKYLEEKRVAGLATKIEQQRQARLARHQL